MHADNPPVNGPPARVEGRGARRASWLIGLVMGCGVLGPPGGEVQYPVRRTLQPAPPSTRSTPDVRSTPDARSAPSTATPATPSAGTAPSASGAPAAPPLPAPGAPGSTLPPPEPEPEPAPGARRTLRRENGSGPAAPAPDQGQLPDPPALALPGSWVYPVTYDHGALRVGEPLLECVKRPQPTPRRMGRFAFELWLGRELIERLRFDFPLLAAETPRTGPRKPLREEPSFAPGARVSVSLRMPASDRATSARIFDRATGKSVAVAWPPSKASGDTPSCPVPKPASHGNAQQRS
jgi:hypothetical protein